MPRRRAITPAAIEGKPKRNTRRQRTAAAEPLSHNPTDAGTAAGCGRSTIYRAIAAGELKAHKRGSRTFILDEDLRAWLRAMPVLVPGRKALA